MTSADSLIICSQEDDVVTLALNRPEKRNALNVDLFVELDDHLGRIEREADQIGLVILRANGPVFSAGADVQDRQRPPKRHFQAKTIERLANLPQPVIAAVQGACFAGGLELVLAADIIIASESACFADTHARWGLTPAWGLSQRLPRRVGTYKAREMMFTGRSYDGRQAERMGLTNFCVADALFETALAELVGSICEGSPHSHRGNKRLLLDTDAMALKQGLAHEIYYAPGRATDVGKRLSMKFGLEDG
ncbi:enoyl-CoA hydratase/isomerase family protein [Sphingomonas sp. SRS2]|uniref:enoyl-CoA hydratase/isomerase family protein n=1 Tax=Sphingomonas sp. SRS2 TaxID=133190 RepID=UPI0006184174|nr:enoyl-CoA hydratase/isomerase family protein [Sphingomonas sp. SRS2]KKC25220.1 enoyl-CoA hydratase [Sphingomonas sp. SRS2]